LPPDHGVRAAFGLPKLDVQILHWETGMAATIITNWRRYFGLPAALVLAVVASLLLTSNPPSEAASPELLLPLTAVESERRPFPGATTVCAIVYGPVRCGSVTGGGGVNSRP
jgi:hypothetical protein